MPGMNDVKAGGAFVEFSVKSAKFRAGLKDAEQTFKRFGAGLAMAGGAIASVGASIAVGLLAAAKHAADAGSNLVDMSDRTGMTVESLSALDYALGQSGSTLEEFEAALKKMQKTVSDDEAANKFESLGIELSSLRQLNPQQQLLEIANAIAKIPDPAARTAAAMEIFGKAGTKLLPLMKDGSAGIEQLMKRAKELGLVMSAEDARAAEEFGDELATITNIASRAVSVIGSSVIPVLRGFTNWITEATSGATKWINENRGLVVALGGAAVAIAAVGTAMVAAGTAIWAGSQILLATTAIITGAVSAMWLMVTSTKAMAMAAVASPFIALGLSIRYVLGWLLSLGDAMKDVKSQISTAFSELVGDVQSSWAAIVNALSSGDLAAAGKVGLALLSMEWVRMTTTLQAAWSTLAAEVKSIWISASSTLAKLGISTAATMQLAWQGFNGFMAEVAAGFVGIFAWAFNKVGLMSDETLDTVFDTLDREVKKRQQEAEAAKKSINEARDDMLKSVDQQRDQQQKQFFNDRDERLAELKKQLDDARAELDKAQQRANAPMPKGKEQGKGRAGPEPPDLEAIGSRASAGTFDAGLVSRIFGATGGIEEKQLKKQEEMAGTLKRIEAKLGLTAGTLVLG